LIVSETFIHLNGYEIIDDEDKLYDLVVEIASSYGKAVMN